MKSALRLDGLLCSNDAQVLGVMHKILSKFAIETEVCRELQPALEAVTHRRLDAVIVDWTGGYDPIRVVRAARKSSPNCNSTIVAMVNQGAETHALLVGANFMIPKPTNLDQAGRCMRAAYGTMLQQRRRAARVPVNIPVVARVAEIGMVKANITDLSIGGLALRCEKPLHSDWEVSVMFNLSGAQLIRATGKVVNASPDGRAGIRFSFIPEEELSVLEDWLAHALGKLAEAEIPAGVT
jgi:PilZ domain-containing protein